GFGGLALAEAGASDLEVAHLRHGGTDDAGERRVAAADVDARDPSLLVGVRTERDVRRPSAHQVGGLDAVAGRPDPLGRAHPAVGTHRSGGTDRQAGRAGEVDVRAYA